MQRCLDNMTQIANVAEYTALAQQHRVAK